MTPFVRKLTWWKRRRDEEAELQEELRFHLEEEATGLQADGMSIEASHRAARRELGNMALVLSTPLTVGMFAMKEYCVAAIM